jgi:mono/diheme cytochrome c family protein
VSANREAPGGAEPQAPRGRLSGPSRIILAILVVALAAAGAWFLGDASEREGIVAVTVPELSSEAERGRQAFAEDCSACHGAVAEGSDLGPPLVHPIYRPAHHADFAFVRVIAQGVRAHHWGFGDMPPTPSVSSEAVPEIIAYVRELQRANGID